MFAPASAKRKGVPEAPALPDEIMEEILARLPARSLLRFRCVSRSWDALITSAAFADLHSSRGSPKLFIRPAGYLNSFYAWQPGTSGPVTKIMDSCYFPQDHVFPIGKLCHGLVLLRCTRYYIHYVWNPSTGEMLPLPDRTPFWAAGRMPHPSMSYGLGYSSATGEHKVVRMYCLDDVSVPTTVCEVFTLDKSAYWRPAATKPPVRHVPCNGRQGAVLCNDNLHFIGEAGIITTFSVTDESFGILIMPPEELKNSNFELTELEGCLCAYFGNNGFNPRPDWPYNIWLLRDYTSQGRWEKLCCIDWRGMTDAVTASLKSDWIAPIGMYDAGSNQAKKIMFGTGSCKVFAVDPKTGTLEILFSPDEMIIGECCNGQLPTVGLFQESLKSVGRRSDEIILSLPSAQAWSQVLKWLPASTVGRFNLVTKDWRAIIKTEYFVRAHLYHANLDKSPQIMFTNGMPNGFKSMENLMSRLALPPLIDDGSRVVCSKPCHGLSGGSFLCYDFVCNPATDSYMALPLDKDTELRGFSFYNDMERRQLDYNGDAMFAGRFGLGYDQEMCRHVIVRLAYKERNMMTRGYKLECVIRYVDDMFWEFIDPPPRPIANMPPVYANGKLYWMADTELSQRSSIHEIIMLDVSTREFNVMQGPPCGHGINKRVTIIDLQGVVCVTCAHHGTNTIDIWAMEDDGSWSKEYSIELGRSLQEYSSELVTPLAIDPKTERILLSTGTALGYYDPTTAEIQTIYHLGKNIKGKKFVPILFQESLVSPCHRIF
ncbi:hypothetical protein ACP70R_019094 [Stipagrostis hirtigluma subsp. patula]